MKTVATLMMLALAFPAAAQAFGPGKSAQKIDAATIEKPLAKQVRNAAMQKKEQELLQSIATYMQWCDYGYKPSAKGVSAEQVVIARVTSLDKKTFSTTSACLAERKNIQNQIAADYWTPHLKYKSQANAKVEWGKLWAVVKEYFKAAVSADSNATDSKLFAAYAEAAANVAKAGK